MSTSIVHGSGGVSRAVIVVHFILLPFEIRTTSSCWIGIGIGIGIVAVIELMLMLMLMLMVFTVIEIIVGSSSSSSSDAIGCKIEAAVFSLFPLSSS